MMHEALKIRLSLTCTNSIDRPGFALSVWFSKNTATSTQVRNQRLTVIMGMFIFTELSFFYRAAAGSLCLPNESCSCSYLQGLPTPSNVCLMFKKCATGTGGVVEAPSLFFFCLNDVLRVPGGNPASEEGWGRICGVPTLHPPPGIEI